MQSAIAVLCAWVALTWDGGVPWRAVMVFAAASVVAIFATAAIGGRTLPVEIEG